MRLPRRRRAESSGWRGGAAIAVALGGLLLGLLGLTVRLELLLIPGLGFLLLGVLALVWVALSAKGAAIARGAVPRRVTEGDPFDTTITVRGRGLPLANSILHEPLSDRQLRMSNRLARRRRGSERSLVVIAHAGRRGMHPVPAPTLTVSDPLGLASRTIIGAGDRQDLLVLPRIEPVIWSAGGRGRLGGGEGASREPTGAGEVDGLREYRPGAPATRIHWPSLARGAGLLERRLIAAAEMMPVIMLDPRCEDSAEGLADLDKAVRAAGSLARELGMRGGCSVLLPGLRAPVTIRPDLRALAGLQTRLALVVAEHDLRRRPAFRPEQLSGGVLVYVRATSAGELPGSGDAVRSSVVVEPHAGDDPPAGAAFAVAGCSGRVVDPRERRSAA